MISLAVLVKVACLGGVRRAHAREDEDE